MGISESAHTRYETHMTCTQSWLYADDKHGVYHECENRGKAGMHLCVISLEGAHGYMQVCVIP